MRRTPMLAVAAGALLLGGCSSSLDKPVAAPTGQVPTTTGVATTATPSAAPSSTQPAAAAETCATPLPDKGDVIVREIFPNVPIDAMELGGTDPEHCVWTMDSLKTSQPTGAGYCSQVAWASDNVGYDPNAVPALPLKNVQAMIGDCG